MNHADYDAGVAFALGEILPPSAEHGDWEQVTADAKGFRRHASRPARRFTLVLALTALAALIPLTALAASNGWWFFGEAAQGHAPAPVGRVVVISTGNWQGIPWALSAYHTASEGLCVAFTPNPPTGASAGTLLQTPAATTLMLSCGAPVRGMPDVQNGAPTHELSFFASASPANVGRKFNAVAGPTAADVASVEISRSDGPPIVVQTVPAPEALAVPIRFFAAVLPLGGTVQTLTARDSGGNTLEVVDVPAAPTGPGGAGSTGGSVTYNMSGGG